MLRWSTLAAALAAFPQGGHTGELGLEAMALDVLSRWPTAPMAETERCGSETGQHCMVEEMVAQLRQRAHDTAAFAALPSACRQAEAESIPPVPPSAPQPEPPQGGAASEESVGITTTTPPADELPLSATGEEGDSVDEPAETVSEPEAEPEAEQQEQVDEPVVAVSDPETEPEEQQEQAEQEQEQEQQQVDEPTDAVPEPEPEPEEQQEQQEQQDACEDGFWRAGDEDECVAWTACSDELEVSIAGSPTSDQLCGRRLVADTVVHEAVDVEQFKAQMVTASGDASAVTILITSFEQIITCAMNVPGSVSDYESTAAQTQFRTGVAVALGVDLSAISELTIEDARRRRLLRRLEDGISSRVAISYDIVITDPTAAAIVAAATKDTAVFAVAFVEAVNAIGGGVLTLDVSLVNVEAPSITTTIEYDIVVQSDDPVAVAAVQTQLADPTVMATALSAATGTDILPDEVVGTMTATRLVAYA